MSKYGQFSAGFKTLLPIIATAVLFVACGKGGTSSTSSSNQNTPQITTQTGRGSAPLNSIPVASGNSVPLVVDAGPVVGFPSVNVGYVTVTVCPPGTSGSSVACQTIDHVTLDTGSYGLRLLNSTLSSSLNLPAVTTSSGATIAECVKYVVGVTWGTIRYADIYIGGEIARNVPIQDIGDTPAGVTTIPPDCSGAIENTLATLGSNGILGVGPFVNDCDLCLQQAGSAHYYSCTSAGCANSIVTSSQVVRNPIAGFTQDNNGVLISLPSVVDAGSLGVTGTVYFGIGTQTNNALSAVNVYATNALGNFTTNYNGTVQTSYLDSGSNGLFFNDTMPVCPVNKWTYCPTTTSTLSAINYAASGNPFGTVPFTVVNADNVFTNPNIVAANIGGPGSAGTFAWGLPFYYGKLVYTAIANKSTPAGAGPYWAY